jgi:glycosyltransferase involved in cell wall biosynthesis
VNPILCLARNNLALTRKAVASFLVQDVPVEVLLINNASTDGTASWMATLDKRVTQIHLREQQSVAAAWNYGLRWCFKAGAEHVLVVNNDTEIKPWTYRLLVEDGGGFVTAVGVSNREQFDEAPEPENKRPHPDYSCYLIRKEVFDIVPFDEQYLLAFAEDAQHHVSMHRSGIAAYCIGVPFYHVGSATVKLADPEEVERICEQAERNRERFYAKYGVRIGTPEYDTLFTPETFGIDLPIKPDKLLV